MQLVVPLTSKQQCSFPLRTNQNIRQLIQEIRVEDPTRETVTITDLNGNRYAHPTLFESFSLTPRMSHSTSLQHLLKHPFCVKLDGETFQITPPAEDFKRALGNVEVEELTQQVYYQKIKQRLLSQKRSFILYSYALSLSFLRCSSLAREFVSWCAEYGIPAEKARDLCTALHLVGDVLYFPKNGVLKDYILLSSKEVMDTVINSLDIKLIKYATENR